MKKYRNLLCVSTIAFACIDLCYARFDKAMQENAERHMRGKNKLFLCNKQALQESYLLNAAFRIESNKLCGDKTTYPEKEGQVEIDNKKYKQKWKAGEVGTFAGDIGALTKIHPNLKNMGILVQYNTDGSPKLREGVVDPLLKTRKIIEKNILNNVFTNTDPDAQKLFELYTFSYYDDSVKSQEVSIEEFKLAKSNYEEFKKQRLEEVWKAIRDSKKKHSVLNGYYTLYCLHKIAKLTKDVRSVVSYMTSDEFRDFVKLSRLANLKITINNRTYGNLYEYMAEQVAPLNKIIGVNNPENTESVVFFMAEKVLAVFKHLKDKTEFSPSYSQFFDIINKIENYKDMFEENSSLIKLTWVKKQWNDFFDSFREFLKKDANEEMGDGFDEAKRQGVGHGTVGTSDKVSIQGLSKELVEVTNDAMCYINGYKLNDFIWNHWENIDIGGDETLMCFKTACQNLKGVFTRTREDLFDRAMPEKGLFQKNIDFLEKTNDISNRKNISSLSIENDATEEASRRIKLFEDVADGFLHVDEMLEKTTQQMKHFENGNVDVDSIKQMLKAEEDDNKELIKTLVEKINFAIETHFKGINKIEIVDDCKNYCISFEGKNLDKEQYIWNLQIIGGEIIEFLSVFFDKTHLKDIGMEFDVFGYDYSDKLKTFLLQKQNDRDSLTAILRKAGRPWEFAVGLSKAKEEYTGIIYALCAIVDALKIHNVKEHVNTTKGLVDGQKCAVANNDALDILHETTTIVSNDVLCADGNIASLQDCSHSAFCIPSSCCTSEQDKIEKGLFEELSRLLRCYLYYAKVLDNVENIEGKLSECVIKFAKVGGSSYTISNARAWKNHFKKIGNSIKEENALIKVGKTESTSTANRMIDQSGNEFAISQHRDINNAFVKVDECFQKLKVLIDVIPEREGNQKLYKKCVDDYSKAVANAWNSVELLRTRCNDCMIRKLGESIRISHDYLSYSLMKENLTHTDITKSYNMLLGSTPTCNYLPILGNMNSQEENGNKRESSLLAEAEKSAVDFLKDGGVSKALAAYLTWSVNPFEAVQRKSANVLKWTETVARKDKNYIALRIIKLIQNGHLKIVDSEKQKVVLHDSASKVLEQRLDELMYGFDNAKKIALECVKKSIYDIFGEDNLKENIQSKLYDGASNIREVVDLKVEHSRKLLGALEGFITYYQDQRKRFCCNLRDYIMGDVISCSRSTWLTVSSLAVCYFNSDERQRCSYNLDKFEKITFTGEVEKELQESINTAIIVCYEKAILSKITDKVRSSLTKIINDASFDSMFKHFIESNSEKVLNEQISCFYYYTLERITDECLEYILLRDNDKKLTVAGNLEKLILDCFRNSTFVDCGSVNSEEKIDKLSEFLIKGSFEVKGVKTNTKKTLASIRAAINNMYEEVVKDVDDKFVRELEQDIEKIWKDDNKVFKINGDNLRDKFENVIKEVWAGIRKEVVETHNKSVEDGQKILDDKVNAEKK